MSRVVEVVAPRRLGIGFRWLLSSSWVSNLGDGIAIAAGPLLVASLTRDPRLIALAATLQWLPPLLFGLPAGVITDRVDRRLLVVIVDVARAIVLVVLAATIVSGHVSVVIVLSALFLLGCAEVFADNASQTLLPMLVSRDDLALANSRLQTGFVTVNQLIGPPLGALLFAAGRALPFVTQAVVISLGAILISRLRLPPHGRDAEAESHVWHDIRDGLHFALTHPAVRTLILTIFIFNITFGAAWSVLVLYASERLGLGAIGFGLITTVGALGGLVGVTAYGWLTRRLSLGDIMRIGLVIETFTHLGLALTSNPWVALPIFFVFGAHAFVWGTTSITVRQRVVPLDFQGRVGGVNLLGVFGGLVIGSTIGGALAHRWGVTAPFWFAFVGSAIFLVLIWGQLRHLVHPDAAPAPDAPDAPA